MGVCVPEEHGGAGRRLPLLRARARGALARRRRGGGDRRGPHERRHAAAADPRHARAGRADGPAAGPGARARGLRADRVGLGLGRRGDAHARGDRRRLTGTKQWITNGSHAHSFLVFARDPERASAFVVRRGAHGFAVTREEEKMGLNSSSTADLSFEDTPAELLGVKGAGMRIALQTLDAGRIGIAAQAVGIAQAALDVAAAYAQERHAFGRPIGGFGAIQQKLADMQTEIEAARALVWRAARLKEAGRPHTRRGRPGQALRLARRAPLDGRGDPGPRRLRLHQGVPGRALLPRRQGDRDLRGHERDPAPGHRPRAAGRGRARVVVWRRPEQHHRGKVSPDRRRGRGRDRSGADLPNCPGLHPVSGCNPGQFAPGASAGGPPLPR